MRVPVVHVYHEQARYLADLVERAAPDRRVVALATPAELADALPTIDVLFAPTPPRDGWAGASRLRLVQLLGVGADTLLPSPDLPPRVAVAGVRGAFATEVAEHVLALMLAHVRGLADLAVHQRARRFVREPRGTLAGQSLVIVGYGAVGQRIARLARALDMTVCAVSRSGQPRADLAGVDVVGASQLAEAVASAAFVVLACPLTPATRGLIDGSLLARMRRDAYLVNVARGGIVDEAALASALAAGHLAGAALDVFADEPLPSESPLWGVRGLTISPHVAGLGQRYVERCVEALLANVAALEAQGTPAGLVDRDVGY